MNRDTHQAPERTFPCDQRDHGVLHASVSALNDGVFRVSVWGNVLVDECHGLAGISGQGAPIAVQIWTRLMDQTQGDAIHINRTCDVVGVCGPRKVNDVLGLEAVLQTRAAVGHGRSPCAEPHARGANHVAFREVQGHVVVTPNAMKLPPDVGVRMPSMMVKLADFGEPLGHAVFNPFFVHPSGAADLARHLCLPSEFEGGHASWSERGVQIDHHHGPVFLKRSGHAIHLDRFDPLPSPFVFRQFNDAAAHTAIRIRNGA